MKTTHSNVGLLNVLFVPGASGTFLANILARAITDPWNSGYYPRTPNKLYEVTNEFINEYNHIAMTWHPFDLSNTDERFELQGVKWINILVTKENAKFTNIMATIKRQDYSGITKQDILDRLYADEIFEYNETIARQGMVADMLRANNDVLDVHWSDIFEHGDESVILSMINHLYRGEYKAYDTITNISNHLVEYHKTNIAMYNELKYKPDEVIDNILNVAKEFREES